MRFVILLASRYLFSKKSNNVINLISWISLLAISFITAAFVIIISVMNGFTSVVSNLYNSVEPDLKITIAKGKYFRTDSVLPILLRKKEIKHISKVIYNQALIKYKQKQFLTNLRGVDSIFDKVTRIDSVIQKGRFILKENNTHYVVMGQGIVNEMDINIANQFTPIVFYSPKRVKNTSTSSDIINEKVAYLSGVFSINDDFDYKYLFCDLKFAQDLFDAEGMVSALEISVKEKHNVTKLQSELKEVLGGKFIVKNREELNDVLFKTLQTEKLWTFIILSFILIIATFSIISALTMLIIEKQNDIQTLYALGASKRMIESIFMVEGFLITFGGALVGLVIGIIVCFIQIRFHIITFSENSIMPYYPVKLEMNDILLILFVLLIIGFIAAIYPVRFFTKEIKWKR